MSTEQERAAFKAGFLAVWNRPHDENPAHWSFDGPAAVDKEPEAWAAWAETAPPAGAQMPEPRQCLGAVHVRTSPWTCQCGAQNTSPAGAQGETPRRCEGDQHIADGIGGCQCGNLYSRNLAPEGSAQQAEEIATLKAEREAFYMDYRIKCDRETKAQAEEIARLRAARSDDAAVVLSLRQELNVSYPDLRVQVQALQAQLDGMVAPEERDQWKREAQRLAGLLSEAQQRIETLTAEMDDAVAAEREACAGVADDSLEDEEYGHAAFRCVLIAQRIRERGVPAVPQEDQP